jgi:hypothetical protein
VHFHTFAGKMKPHIFTGVLFWFFCAHAGAQLLPNFGGQRAGLSTLSFLKNDLNPGSVGRSGASIALEGDAYSSLTNPASLTGLSNTTIGLSHMLLGAGIQQTFGVAHFKLESEATWGLSVNSLNSGQMAVRTEFQPDGTGQYFSVSQAALSGHYAQKLSDMFSIGVQLKLVGESMATYSNLTAAVDLGFLYETDLKNLKFAVVIQNFGGNSSLNGEEIAVGFNRSAEIELRRYTLPTLFRMGLSFDAWQKDKHTLQVSGELNHPNDNAENIRLGVAYKYHNLLEVYTGYKIGVPGFSYPTFGFLYNATVGVNRVGIHYAVLPTNYLGTQHTFGLSFKINKDTR